eukprot:m51a1_g7946 hypothetical protein (1783) ;mRNA; r:122200-148804
MTERVGRHWDPTAAGEDLMGVLNNYLLLHIVEMLDRCSRVSMVSDAGLSSSVVFLGRSLRTLAVHSCEALTDSALSSLAVLCPQLQALSLLCCPRVGDSGTSAIARALSPRLCYAELMGCRLGAGRGLLKGLAEGRDQSAVLPLEDFGSDTLTSADLCDAFGHTGTLFWGLRRLWLPVVHADDPTSAAAAVAIAAACPSLVDLRLGDGVPALGVELTPALAACIASLGRLRSLSLACFGGSERGAVERAVSVLGSCAPLESLRLAGLWLTREFVSGPACRELASASLEQVCADNATLAALPAQRLRRPSLVRCWGYSSRGVWQLLRRAAGLRSLELREEYVHGIGDDRMASVVALSAASMPRLGDLALELPLATDEGAAELSRVCARLEELEVHAPLLTEDGANELLRAAGPRARAIDLCRAAEGPSLHLGIAVLVPDVLVPSSSLLTGSERYQTPDTPMWEGVSVCVAPSAPHGQQPPGEDNRSVEFVVLSSTSSPVLGVVDIRDIRVGCGEVELHTTSEFGNVPAWRLSYEAAAPAPPAALVLSRFRALALLVGADRISGQGVRLRGPRNDAGLMAQWAGRFADRAGDQTTLLGEEATLGNIETGLAGLAERAGRGDVVLFYFSGLGTTSVRPLGCDELGIPALPAACLCPFDVLPEDTSSGAFKLLSSVRVAQLLSPALRKGATVNIVLDCDFGGGPRSTAPIGPGGVRDDALGSGASEARYKHLALPDSLPSHPRGHGPVNSFSRVVSILSGNADDGEDTHHRGSRAAGSATALTPCISVGSVLDTLRVGAETSGGAASSAASGRWVDIARGSEAFGAGIVEAAKRAPAATRDVAQDRAALAALEAMTRGQWEAVALQAIELDPRGMSPVVDSVAGGLDASPARGQLLARALSDGALIDTLAAAAPTSERGWREREAPLVLGARGDGERLRRALQELPYQRKLQLLDAQLGLDQRGIEQLGEMPLEDKELVTQAAGRPWVGVLSRMLAQAPDTTRASTWPDGYNYSDPSKGGSAAPDALQWTAARDVCNVALATAFVGTGTGERGDHIWSSKSRAEFVGKAGDLLRMHGDGGVYGVQHALSLLTESQLAGILYDQETVPPASIGPLLQAMHITRSRTAILSNRQWLDLLMCLVEHYGAELLQKVGDLLGHVVGRRVDTEEISDSEGEGLAELVREFASAEYYISLESAVDPGWYGLFTVSLWSLLNQVLVAWDSPVSYRVVLHDSEVTGQLCDPQIQVVTPTTAKAEASRAQWVPTDGNLGDLDSIHAFTAVRSVVDAFERVLRGRAGSAKEDFMQELPALDEGRCPDGGTEETGLRWQVGNRLLVDTRAKEVDQPTSSSSICTNKTEGECIASALNSSQACALRYHEWKLTSTCIDMRKPFGKQPNEMGVDTGYAWLRLGYNASTDAPWPAAEAAIHSVVSRCIEPLAVSTDVVVKPGFYFRIAPAPPSPSLVPQLPRSPKLFIANITRVSLEATALSLQAAMRQCVDPFEYNLTVSLARSAGTRFRAVLSPAADHFPGARSPGEAFDMALYLCLQQAAESVLAGKALFVLKWQQFKQGDPAMHSLPLIAGNVFCGIACAVDASAYAVGCTVCWNGFTSTSRSSAVATEFLRSPDPSASPSPSGMLFELCVASRRSLGSLNQFGEDEVLLESGTAFVVESVLSTAQDACSLLVVRMREKPETGSTRASIREPAGFGAPEATQTEGTEGLGGQRRSLVGAEAPSRHSGHSKGGSRHGHGNGHAGRRADGQTGKRAKQRDVAGQGQPPLAEIRSTTPGF